MSILSAERLGWKCPNCGSAHSPDVLTCPHGPPEIMSVPSLCDRCECGLYFTQTCSRTDCKRNQHLKLWHWLTLKHSDHRTPKQKRAGRALLKQLDARDQDFNELLIAYGNAQFACGDYQQDDDGPESYKALLAKALTAKDAVHAHIDSLTSRLASVTKERDELRVALRPFAEAVKYAFELSDHLTAVDAMHRRDYFMWNVGRKLCMQHFHEAHKALDAAISNGEQGK